MQASDVQQFKVPPGQLFIPHLNPAAHWSLLVHPPLPSLQGIPAFAQQSASALLGRQRAVQHLTPSLTPGGQSSGVPQMWPGKHWSSDKQPPSPSPHWPLQPDKPGGVIGVGGTGGPGGVGGSGGVINGSSVQQLIVGSNPAGQFWNPHLRPIMHWLSSVQPPSSSPHGCSSEQQVGLLSSAEHFSVSRNVKIVQCCKLMIKNQLPTWQAASKLRKLVEPTLNFRLSTSNLQDLVSKLAPKTWMMTSSP